MAKRKLSIQTKCLRKQEEQCKKYQVTFEKMEDERHVEVVENKAYTEIEQPVHYITYFATEQDKFRIVYNGALKINGICLNDMLYRGSMFLEPSVEILIRFRQYKYAVMADIRNMFFQIRLDPKDRDMLRFFSIY